MARLAYSRALSSSSREWFDDCRLAEEVGVSHVSSADVPGCDAFVDAALAYAATETSAVGIGVALPTRSPLQTALGASSLATFGRTLTLGLGIGTQPTNDAHGIGYDPPVGRLRDYLRCVKGVLHSSQNDQVVIESEHYKVVAPGLGRDASEVTVVLGAQGPQSVKLAAREADGLILHLMTARTVLSSRVELVGQVRDNQKPFALSAGMLVAVDSDDGAALARARADVTAALSRPAYTQRLADAAGEELMDEFRSLTDEARWQEAAALLPESVVRDFILITTPDKFRQDIAAIDIVDEVIPVNIGNYYRQIGDAFGLTQEDTANDRAALRSAVLS